MVAAIFQIIAEWAVDAAEGRRQGRGKDAAAPTAHFHCRHVPRRYWSPMRWKHRLHAVKEMVLSNRANYLP
jgi:hypothetical protein